MDLSAPGTSWSELEKDAFRRRLISWGREHRQVFPWREPVPEWQALVAEVMLQRTRAEQVVPVFERFREEFRTPADFGAATLDDIQDLVHPLGLRWRAPLIADLAREIGRNNGRIPRDAVALERLPGVGPYAAAATLTLHLDIRAVLIDSNVVRVLCRLVGTPYDGETRRKRWLREFANGLTPSVDHSTYNYALLDLAMQICRSGRPECHQCPLASACTTGTQRLMREAHSS